MLRPVWLRLLFRRLLLFVATLLVVGFVGAALVRLAPGFGVDERELDARLREESIQSLQKRNAGDGNVLQFYVAYLKRLTRGDWGYSSSLARPIAELFTERYAVTLATVTLGLFGGWTAGLLAATIATVSRRRVASVLISTASGLLLCLPSALVALFFLFLAGPVALAVSCVVFPKVFQYTRNLLSESYARPHILAARARGLTESRIFGRHVLPVAAPQILALAGVSVNIAIGASIPIEVICDSPGLGQLAWKAALGRDLPLLVGLTLVVTFVTLLANSASDLAIAASEHER